MLQDYDLKSVQEFALQLDARRETCSDEGMECSNLDETIRCQYELCLAFSEEVQQWAARVFTGQIAYDPEVDVLFLDQLDKMLNSARPVLETGRDLDSVCWRFKYLNRLQTVVARLEYLKANWVSPKKSVAPSRRVSIGEIAKKEIQERLAVLAQTDELPAAG